MEAKPKNPSPCPAALVVLDSKLPLPTQRSPLPRSYMPAALLLCCALAFRSIFPWKLPLAGPYPSRCYFQLCQAREASRIWAKAVEDGDHWYHAVALISLQKLQKYVCKARIRAYKNNTSLYTLGFGNGLADGRSVVVLQRVSHLLSLLPWCLCPPAG